MAKIKFGMIVTDGRGKLGGQVFSKNRSGSYIRTKVTPVNPQTTIQQAVRASFGAFSQAWSGLSASTILAWNEAVSSWSKTDIFGDLRNPTGKNLYVRLNQQLAVSLQASISTPPAKLEMVQGIVSAATVDATANTIDFTGIYAGGDANVMIFATPPLSAGTSYVKNKLRLIYPTLASSFSDLACYAAYETVFGTSPDASQNIKFGIKYVLPNGQVSPLQIL